MFWTRLGDRPFKGGTDFMEIKPYILIGMSIATLLLAACNRESIEDIETSVNEVESLHGQAISEVNGLYEDESNLQNVFNETLKTDETLSSLSDGSSAVFENIEIREGRLNTIEEIEDQIKEHADVFTSYEGEMISTDELESVVLEMENFVFSLESFRQQYGETLTTQEKYFGTIATEGATTDTFLDGMEEINVEREGMQDILIDLDNRFVDLEEVISSFQSTIEDALDESEEE